jgi:hypothetical protein
VFGEIQIIFEIKVTEVHQQEVVLGLDMIIGIKHLE